MMGNGIWCEKLKKRIQDENLSNFTFLDYQPYSLIPQIYAASDLCLVPQLPSITHSAVPSKVYRIMACARPVLASTAPESDLASLIDKVDCGIIVEGGSHHQLAEAILWASKKPEQLRAMGEAGRAHVVECYSRKAISKQYHVLAESILKKSNH